MYIYISIRIYIYVYILRTYMYVYRYKNMYMYHTYVCRAYLASELAVLEVEFVGVDVVDAHLFLERTRRPASSIGVSISTKIK